MLYPKSPYRLVLIISNYPSVIPSKFTAAITLKLYPQSPHRLVPVVSYYLAVNFHGIPTHPATTVRLV